MHIILFEPEIPQNTGNIIRTCVCTGATLHLIKPFGFHLTDKLLKRSAMDYMKVADMNIYRNFDEFITTFQWDNLIFFTTKVDRPYFAHTYHQQTGLVFGPESRGLPDHILKKYDSQLVTIPMKKNPNVRSLNLSNAVSIGIYEGIRQTNFI